MDPSKGFKGKKMSGHRYLFVSSDPVVYPTAVEGSLPSQKTNLCQSQNSERLKKLWLTLTNYDPPHMLLELVLTGMRIVIF